MYFIKKTYKIYKKTAPNVFLKSIFPRGYAKKKLFYFPPPKLTFFCTKVKKLKKSVFFV